jgi:hypothetical protein
LKRKTVFEENVSQSRAGKGKMRGLRVPYQVAR